MGGESLYFGKPHPPIYDLARRRMIALGRDIDDVANQRSVPNDLQAFDDSWALLFGPIAHGQAG